MVALVFIAVFCLIVAIWATPWYIWGSAILLALAVATVVHLVREA
jgi:hypothetical protein